MSNFYTRQHYKDEYGPLSQKTLHNVLKRELFEQFGFENMGLIADALIKRFLEIIDEFSPEKIRLLPGQVLWLAVDAREKCGYGKPIFRSKLVPVILTLVSPDDLQRMAEERVTRKELYPEIIARILKEAMKQGGVLALSDVGVLLGLSHSRVSRIIKRYSKEHQDDVLPHRGTVHDIGPTITHKIQAIELKLKGLFTQEIARRICHDPSAVDVYVNDFERVYELYRKGESIVKICFYTKLSRTLVEEYIKIVKELKENTQS
jgi:predicted XRE-type DNA-binding protein